MFLFGYIVQAQVDTIFDTSLRDFENYRKSADYDFIKFKTQNDSAFLKFLEQTWQEFEIFRNAQPVKPKPKNQPTLQSEPQNDKKSIDYIIPEQTSFVINEEEGIIDTAIQEFKIKDYKSSAILKSISIFGSNANLFYYPSKLPRLISINEKSIYTFYKELLTNNTIWDYNINALEKLKLTSNFNDWGYFMILSKAAESIFNNRNEEILFIWYALIKSGYCLKVGYNNGSLYLLVPSKQILYGIPFLTDKGLQYYILNYEDNQPVHLKTYQGFFTDSAKVFSFKMSGIPLINNEKAEGRELNFNQERVNLIFNKSYLDFLNIYPQCDLNIYFDLPLSSSNLTILSKLFLPMFQGKTNVEKINILLAFIQKAIPYRTDQEQFGKERYMFAEECLFYPFSDCEDRTVLLSQLVKYFTGLPCIGLEFNDHITLAVNFPEEVKGTYILYQGQKFFICDPTYINAKSGMLPPDLEKEKPLVITF